MDACYGTLALVGIMMVVTLIFSVRSQRARRRREEEERARAQAQLQAQHAHAQWQQQQFLLQQAHAEQARRAEEARIAYERAQAEQARRAQEARVAYERAQAEQARHASLTARFGAENATRIMRGEFWQGQTAEMLVEALGRPVDIDEKVLKTKSRQIYKYRPMGGANRYGLRITLENGVVVGWDEKS